MTTQEAYEAQIAWFSRPDAEYGFDLEDNECVYRGDGGVEDSEVRCAIGCLIPDELYTPEWESEWANVVIDHLGACGDGGPFADVDDVEYLEASQRVHDQAARDRKPLADFLEELHHLARNSGLTVVAS